MEIMEGSEEFEIIAGTYENFVLGLSFRQLEGNIFELKQSFASCSHMASVRTVACSGKFAASGSADEVIQLYNMEKRKEMGSLMRQEGTINSLCFFDKSHLFSASDDGTICVYDTGSWQCLKTLKGHKQAVNDIAVHNSGKLLLSVSKDKSIYTWNLVKGRPAFITNIKVEASRVKWCPSGTMFVVVHNNNCDLYSTDVGGVVGTIDFGKRISDLTFIGDFLVLSGEEGMVNVFDLTIKNDLGKVEPACIVTLKADPTSRVRCVSYGGPSSKMGCHFLVTATSEGCLSVWLVNVTDSNEEPVRLARHSVGNRITSCAIHKRGET